MAYLELDSYQFMINCKKYSSKLAFDRLRPKKFNNLNVLVSSVHLTQYIYKINHNILVANYERLENLQKMIAFISLSEIINY